MEKKVMARFQPQAWIHNNAVNVDAAGEVEFDVTPEILEMGRERSLTIEDDSWVSDGFQSAKNAPQWIKNWYGPFYVEVEDSIREYYGIDD
jgi:hypothetical protein